MAKLRLIKGISYMYKGYSFKKNRAVDVDDKDSKYLLETGHFEQVGEDKTVSEEVPENENKEEASDEAEVNFTEEVPEESPKKATKKSK